jgi:dihydrodipicolinate synthase/N-acetylneuraminate lyase
MPQRLRGVLAPVVTPFKQDFAPDPQRFVRHCKWLLAHGCSGLAVFGTTSEANSLSADERMMLLEQLVESGVPAECRMLFDHRVDTLDGARDQARLRRSAHAAALLLQRRA